jgi:hypothetical protein
MRRALFDPGVQRLVNSAIQRDKGLAGVGERIKARPPADDRVDDLNQLRVAASGGR